MTQETRNIFFRVPGLPHPWSVQTRYAKNNSKQRLKGYQAEVALNARVAMQGRPPTGNLVALELTFGCSEKGWERWDTTNLQKACEDALKGIIMLDDKQVVDIHSRKVVGDPPYTEIWVKILEDEPSAPEPGLKE